MRVLFFIPAYSTCFCPCGESDSFLEPREIYHKGFCKHSMCVASVDPANAKGIVLNFSSAKEFGEERAEQCGPGTNSSACFLLPQNLGDS